MPPRLMTATSVVPPPMSTMRLPDGSLTGRPAPIAAAIGSSMRRAQRAPALRAASRTARFSTSVTPDGMPSSIRGRGISPTRSWTRFDEVLDHLLGDVEVADDPVAQRPDRDDVGRRPADHPLGLGADRQDPLASSRRWRRRDGSLMTMPAVADVDERVGGPEVDPDVAGEEAEEAVEHGAGRVLRGVIGRRGAGRGRRPGRAGRAGGRKARAVYPRARGLTDGPSSGGAPAASPARPVQRRARRGAGPVEGDAAVAQRDVGVVADDEVVEQVDVQQPAGGQRLGGQVQVVRRRRRVAATGGCGRGSRPPR